MCVNLSYFTACAPPSRTRVNVMALFHAEADAVLRRISYPLIILVNKKQTAIMLPGAYNEEESGALRSTVTVNYGLEVDDDDYETAEEVVTIGSSRPLFGLRQCAPFVRPTNPKQAYFVGVADTCLAFAIVLPPILGFTLSLEARVFAACWVGMRFFGY